VLRLKGVAVSVPGAALEPTEADRVEMAASRARRRVHDILAAAAAAAPPSAVCAACFPSHCVPQRFQCSTLRSLQCWMRLSATANAWLPARLPRSAGRALSAHAGPASSRPARLRSLDSPVRLRHDGGAGLGRKTVQQRERLPRRA